MRLQPSLPRQCWLFAAGAAFFAIGCAPRFAVEVGAGASDLLCFIGSWFFTTAAWMQLRLSGEEGSLQWYSAAVQFTGTVLFNVSTAAAVWLHSIPERRHLVWTPDVFGSVAFLVSGVLAVGALGAVCTRRDRQTTWINMAGCVAFGVSAVAGFVRHSGVTEDQWLANFGTFLGALCFLVAALLALPRFRKPAPTLRQSPV